jgi:peptidoglycan/LPS O-acetylase OafA/YrhL
LTNKRFESLDTFRFFAFFVVFLLHIPDYFQNTVFNKFKSGGNIGVPFFFVLSGFLITYLLSKEKQEKGFINPKRFMIRRILRIWPLYYIGIVIACLNLTITQNFGWGSNEGYVPNLLYSLTFTENIKMLMEDNFPNGAPLRVFWSLCVEEHFYILWLIIFKYIPLKRILMFLFSFIVAGIVYRYFSPVIYGNRQITEVDLIANLDYFSVGGIIALIMIVYPSIIIKLKKIISSQIALLYILLCCVFFFFHHYFLSETIRKSIIFPTISAVVFALFIGFFAAGFIKQQISNKSFPGRLGSIGYGLYVYHTPVILVQMHIFQKLNWICSGWTLLGFILLALTVTIFVSKISYKYIETPFLIMRNKYYK